MYLLSGRASFWEGGKKGTLLEPIAFSSLPVSPVLSFLQNCAGLKTRKFRSQPQCCAGRENVIFDSLSNPTLVLAGPDLVSLFTAFALALCVWLAPFRLRRVPESRARRSGGGFCKALSQIVRKIAAAAAAAAAAVRGCCCNLAHTLQTCNESKLATRALA